MDEQQFFSFVTAQQTYQLSESNIIFDRSSKTVAIVALLAGATVYLSTFDYLSNLGFLVGVYYSCMFANAIILAFASLSLACAFKNRGYDVANVKEWNNWRNDYAKSFTDDMGFTSEEISNTIAKDLCISLTTELCQYVVDNKAVNERRRWFVDLAISLSIISLFLIFGQAMCKLVLEQILVIS